MLPSTVTSPREVQIRVKNKTKQGVPTEKHTQNKQNPQRSCLRIVQRNPRDGGVVKRVGSEMNSFQRAMKLGPE